MLGLNAASVLAIIVLVLFVVLYFLFWSQIERGRRINLRPLLPLNRLRRMVQETVETGQKVHFSPGNGGLNGQAGTAEALSGLTTLSSVQQMAARTKGQIITTTNDALTNLLAADISSDEFDRAGRAADFKPEETRFITQQENLAYIAGVGSIISEEKVSGNVIIGRVGPEYLLVGDIANRRNLSQVVGTTQVETMPLMIASAGSENTLLGEEVFATPAYLNRQPALLASLRTQDMLRGLIILAILIGVVAATLGFNVGDLFIR